METKMALAATAFWGHLEASSVLFVYGRAAYYNNLMIIVIKIALCSPSHRLCIVSTGNGATEPPWEPDMKTYSKHLPFGLHQGHKGVYVKMLCRPYVI